MVAKPSSAAAVASAIAERTGPDIVLGLPIGIGKATAVVDALFDLAAADDSISLTIFTGLTLEPPRGRNELERRFLAPLVERLYAAWPVPKYAAAIRKQTLPDNVRVHEFYLRPGAYLGDTYVQQRYANINYSRVADELMRLGVNVIAQLVAASPERPGRYSLGANPEVTLDLLPWFEERRKKGLPAVLVGQINGNMPYMFGGAELEESCFDFILDDECYDHPLFSLPNRRVSNGDYATAMHVASLVPDGGTIQVGIGSLSDAVAHCLKLRHESPEVFAQTLERLPGGSADPRRNRLPIEQAPFRQGLYASTELLSDALFSLFTAGLVSRAADEATDTFIHAGFFLGSSALYNGLAELPEAHRRRIDMTRISEVNTLFGDESRKRRQRRDACFINETMMITLLGAAVSDALEDGRVVSGVGGQFDFVSMAHALDDASSILMCRARRESRGVASSNIRWSYGHATVPRHHRDVYVTEYGIAATRGRSDRDVVDALLHIADAEFQDRLIADAQRAGKLEADYTLDAWARKNTPTALDAAFDDRRAHFPPYPLGTELTDTEQRLAEALSWLGGRMAKPWSKAQTLMRALIAGERSTDRRALAHMKLDRPNGLEERMLRRLVDYALSRAKT